MEDKPHSHSGTRLRHQKRECRTTIKVVLHFQSRDNQDRIELRIEAGAARCNDTS